MPVQSPQTVTEMIYAGPVSPGVLMAVGAAVAIFAALLIGFEARRVRGWLAVPLALLRVAAVAAVVWMLAGLSIRTETRTTQTKSVAVLTDVSASMFVTDPTPDGRLDARDVRWSAVQADPVVRTFFSHLDGAAGTVAWVDRTLDRLARCSGEGTIPSDAADVLDGVLAQLRSAAEHLYEADHETPVDDEGLRQQVALVRSVLLDEAADRIGVLRRSSVGQAAGDAVAWFDTLAEIHRLVAEQAAELARVSETWADRVGREGPPAVVDRMRVWAERPRADKIAAWLDDARSGGLADVQSQAELAGYQFARGVWPVSPDRLAARPEDRSDEGRMGTDLAEPLQQAAVESLSHRGRAVLLFTDGAHNTGPDPVKSAANLAEAPVFVVPVGRTDPARDVVLHHAKAPATVFKNDVVLFEAMLDAHGLAGRRLTVDLCRDDQVIVSQDFTPDADAYTQRVSLQDKADQEGTYRYQLRVRPLPEERVKDNNQARLDVDVVESELDVLVVDRLPRWEFRYLRKLFARDPRVEARAVLLAEPNAPPGWAAHALPETAAQWQPYRAVILGDVGPEDLSEARQRALEDYVRQGGTVVLIAGPEAMPSAYSAQPLEQLLPVGPYQGPQPGPDGYGLFVTAEGRETAVTQLEDDGAASERLWREQVTIHELSPWAQAKPTAHVLIACVPNGPGLSSDDPPVFLCWHFYGRGRVVYLSAPATYRLRQRFGDWYHHRFWGQFLRWAVAREIAGGARTVQIATDKNPYAHDEPVRVRVRLTDLNKQPVGGAAITVLASQDRQPVGRVALVADDRQPGWYVGTLEALPVGSVALTAMGPQVRDLLEAEQYREPVQTFVQIEPAIQRELRYTQCDLALLSRIAEASGGLVVPPTALDTVISQLDLAPDVSATVQTRPAWNRWWVLLWVVGCLSIEWVARKLAGLA